MTDQREVLIDGNIYGITVSDEREALLAAKVAGRAFVAVGTQMFSGIGVEYAVESFDAVNEEYLERVLRRHRGLPWQITQSERIRIRELTEKDYDCICVEEDAFSDREQYLAYLTGQYRFYEYGLWGIERLKDGVLVGTAGVWNYERKRTGKNSVKIREPQNEWKKKKTISDTDSKTADDKKESPSWKLELELGYRTFAPYRRRGYAEEACRLILSYMEEWYADDDCEMEIFAVTRASNLASENLLKKLGFENSAQKIPV